MSREAPAVVVLAGGEGSRIGGRKPLRELAGQRLIDRAVSLAARYSDTVAVAVREPSQGADLDAAIILDEAIEGPLGGLAAGLRYAGAEGRSHVLAIPADMPFLPADLLDRLGQAIDSKGCAVAGSGGRLHPVCSLWRVDGLERLGDYVATGRRSLQGFAQMVGQVVVEWPGGSQDPFFNINSADDLAEAERRLG